METKTILDRERDFHNKRFANDKGQRVEDGFYRALHDMDVEFYKTVSRLSTDSDVLDYGCGNGLRTAQLCALKQAKSITGIDISEEAIKIATNGVAKDPAVAFYVDNCEQSKLAPASFDLIYGNGIIHHLNTEKAIIEISRLLRSEGSIVFYEPLGTNPLLNLYRRFTPNSRSTDEHPLLPADFEIIKKYLPNMDLKFFGLFSVATLPFYRKPEQSMVYKFSAKLDAFLFRNLRRAKWFAWAVLITAKK